MIWDALVYTNGHMDTAQLVSEIDSEIARLQQARILLLGVGSATHAKSPRRKRSLSAEARARIAAAQRRRWAKQKGAAKKSA
jgi:hypothetical protein